MTPALSLSDIDLRIADVGQLIATFRSYAACGIHLSVEEIAATLHGLLCECGPDSLVVGFAVLLQWATLGCAKCPL